MKSTQILQTNLEIVIATSGPSSTYPQRAYRNPTDALVKFLDYKHGDKWAIWEFRAEGTGYPDSEVYNRIHHYPWPDHHPPPFALIPNIMASARDWLKFPEAKERVLVVHCKAGKGRSGTVACSYLISEEGWTVEDALARFTARRMRNGFGAGVSIPSQLRWIGYVDWWTKHGKIYVERQIEVLEVHVWGLRDGVKVGVEGYVEEGKVIKTFHTFTRDERMVMDPTVEGSTKPASTSDHLNERVLPLAPGTAQSVSLTTTKSSSGPGASTVIFRPSEPIMLPTSDINIDFERRNKATYGFTMVTSVAHVWFNTFFESQRSSTSQPNAATSPADPKPTITDPNNLPESGVFEIDWDAMDGIKGSVRKGIRALDRLAVVWRAVPSQGANIKIITEPAFGEPVPESKPADWTKANSNSEKNLGLRTESPTSEAVSRASSMVDMKDQAIKTPNEGASDSDSEAGVRPHGPEGEEHIPHIPPGEHLDFSPPSTSTSTRTTATTSRNRNNLTVNSNSPTVDLGIEKTHSPAHSPGMVRDVGLGKVAGIVDGMQAEKGNKER